MSFKQSSCPTYNQPLSAEWTRVCSDPHSRNGKAGYKSRIPFPCQDWTNKVSEKAEAFFLPVPMGHWWILLLHSGPISLHDDHIKKKKYATKARTLPLSVAWSTKTKYIMLFFFYFQFHSTGIFSMFQHHGRQNLDWSKCLESTGPPSKVLQCCWSLATLTDL